METKKPELIVAADVNGLAELRELVDHLGDAVNIYKVGSQLFTSCGPAAVRFIEARGKSVFLDLKYHDIPNTVARAVEAAVKLSVAVERSMDYAKPHPPVCRSLLMLTLHTCGGEAMMRAAVESAAKASEEIGVVRPLIVGVTVLTSEQKQDNVLPLVLERALLAQKAGLDGVVAACEEAKFLRKEFGPGFVIVTPGIRPADSATQDQKRVATPKQAVLSGSHYLVVGRPIVQAPQPRIAARRILEEMQS